MVTTDYIIKEPTILKAYSKDELVQAVQRSRAQIAAGRGLAWSDFRSRIREQYGL